MSAEQLRGGISTGQITRGMYVRDEGGTWTPVESSPFASFLDAQKQPESAPIGYLVAKLLVGFGLLSMPLVFFWWIGESSVEPREDSRKDMPTLACEAFGKQPFESNKNLRVESATVTHLGGIAYRCEVVVAFTVDGEKRRTLVEMTLRDESATSKNWVLETTNRFEPVVD